ncbi:TPA: ABC transporter ATP-binding protein [Candidatus Taylorbacteria bacterium]|nr:ABC transporter ATP-binding protein [Candidatus Taylorbacteria bacterium]
MQKRKSTSKVSDVLRIFWQSIRSTKWVFFASAGLFAAYSTLQVTAPIFYKKFFDIVSVTLTDRQSVVGALVGTLVIILFINLARWFCFRMGVFAVNHIEARVMAHLKQRAFTHMINHSYSFFSNNFTGSLVQRVNRMSRAFEKIMDRFIFSIIPLAIYITGTCIVVWQIQPMISLLIIGMAVVFMSFNYVFSRYKLKYDLIVTEADSKTTGLLSDNITNHNAIQLFTSAEYESESYKKQTDEQARATRFAWNLASVVDASQASFLIVIEFFLFYFAVNLWVGGGISIGTFVLIQIYFLNLGDKLWDFSRIIRDLYEGFADAKEMVDIMLLPHEIKNIPNSGPLTVSAGKIEFREVTFGFNPTRQVLSKISAVIPGGQKIALIGPSGAGKSTFIKLILRLYDLAGGAILIDNTDIHSVTQESLREHVSLVPQDPVLFHRTLMENIRYGRKDATDEEVKEAARQAHCDEFVQALPLKYETFVGERGIKLSGGERQRIAIARAILKNAPILILDEATSSLDSESESLIQDALDTLMKSKTTIVIAHRLSTIRKMDRIIVMDGGSIIEDDTHEELLKNETGLYGRLWKLQAGGFIA